MLIANPSLSVTHITLKTKTRRTAGSKWRQFLAKTPHFSRIAPNPPTIARVSSHPQPPSTAQTTPPAPNPPSRRQPADPLTRSSKKFQKIPAPIYR
jgi:hypothetical protein